MAWIAVPATDPQEVARDVGILDFEPANWQTGLWAAYQGRLFITPPIRGWVLVVSLDLPSMGHAPDEHAWRELMESLSRRYREAQYFGSHRVGGYYAWARFENGVESRALAYLDGAVGSFTRGEPTAGEVALGYSYLRSPTARCNSDDEHWSGDPPLWPEEQHVLEVAGKWSLNPTLLNERDAEPAAGWVGDFGSHTT